ncbi:MAG TPA: hypothetical protein VF551_06335 [Chthoniobacterales bacterium]|jgi:hypothetical protein
MKTVILTLLTIAAVAFSVASSRAAEISAEDKQFLESYEKVRAALAADKLEDAKTAAAELGESGAALAKAEKIAAARSELSKLSERAIQLGRGQSGYYVVNCPMLRKDWLQPAGKISNPYDAAMPECGVIRK